MPTPYIYTYSPEDVVFTFGGYELAGWTNISVKPSSYTSKQVRGIRGKHTKVISKDTSCVIYITVDQGSEANYVFNRLVDYDRKFGTVRLEAMLKDTRGGSLFKTSEAYVEGQPEDITYSDDLEIRVWKIICDSTSIELRGNSKNSSPLFEKIKESISGLFS